MNKYPEYDNLALADLVRAMRDLRDAHTDLKVQAAELWKEHEYLAKHKIPQVAGEMEMSSVVIEGLGRLEIRNDVSISVPQENKQQVYDWLEENGYGDLIQGTVNSSTMKAQVKQFVKEGVDFPIDLVNFNPFDNAVLIRSK